PDELVASEGAEVMFTAVVVDERGTPVLSHSEPISLAVVGNRPGIAVEPVGPLAEGAQRFRVRTTGGLSLVGLVYDLEASTLTPEGEALVARKTVEMVPQQAAGIRVEAPAYLAVNTGEELAPVSIWVVDQTGRPVSYGLWELEVTVTGPAVLEGGGSEGKVTYAGSPDPAPAVVRLRSLKGRPGEIRVTVSLDDVEPATATIQGVVAQAASRVALAAEPNGARAAADYVDPEGRYAPEAIGLTVTTTDPTGVPVLGPAEATVEVIAPRPGALAELDIAYVDPLTGRPGEWIPLQSLGGRYTVSLTGGQARLLLRSRGYVGDLTLRARAPGLAEGSARVTFTPGPAYQIAFAEGTDLVYVPAGTETFRLQVQVQDFHGNPTPAGGLPITFTASHPEVKLNGKRRTATVTADAQGLATVEVSLPPGTGTYTITASADGLAGGLARASMTVEVRYAVPHTIQVQFLDAGGQRRTAVPAGEPVTVKAIVTDPHGARVSDLPASALRLAVTEGDLAHDKPEPTGFVAHGNGEYTAVIYPGRGPLTVEVAVPVAGGVRRGTGRLQVSAGPAARVQLVRSGDEGIAVDAYRPTGPFLLRVTDAYGNPAYAQADIIVTFSATGLSAGAYFDVRETPSSAPVTVTGGLTLRATKSIYILAGGDADGRFTLVVTPVTPGVEGDEVPVTIR
ncbi:MAG: hypothetical protein DIU70_011745, partial [Bacillota bacterium]